MSSVPHDIRCVLKAPAFTAVAALMTLLAGYVPAGRAASIVRLIVLRKD